jgi:ornithine decarboxylase
MMSEAKFVLSKSKVLEQYNKIKKISDKVSYSNKTNFEVGEILEKETDCFFSVHSINSLENIENKSRVWFFAQAWTENEILKLFELGITSFVVDNEVDLTKLIKLIDNKEINLLLRLRLRENTIHTGKHFVFGFRSKQVNELLPILKENKNINKLGIHFHRKTQNVSEWSLKEELSEAILEENLTKLDIVNIGGGIPSIYKNHRPEVINYIFDKIKETKEWLNSKNIDVITEPGRFIAGPSVQLETEIVNKYDNNLVVNCSVYNAAMDTFIANIRLLVKDELEEGQKYTIKGSTPDSMDIFRYSVYLDNPKIGDKLVFLNAGAYNFSTEFCKLPKLKTEVIE